MPFDAEAMAIVVAHYNSTDAEAAKAIATALQAAYSEGLRRAADVARERGEGYANATRLTKYNVIEVTARAALLDCADAITRELALEGEACGKLYGGADNGMRPTWPASTCTLPTGHAGPCGNGGGR